MPSRGTTLIIGAGIGGLSTAWHLVATGEHDVLVIERGTIGSGSSLLNAGIFRSAGSDPITVQLTLRSRAFLAAPPPELGVPPLLRPDGLILAARDAAGEAELEVLETKSPKALEHRRLEPAALHERLPWYREPLAAGIEYPEDGRIDIHGLIRGLARATRARGGRIETGRTVERLLVEDGAVRGARLADGRELRAERTVLAAGGWAGRLGREAGSGVVLRPTRRHLARFRADPIDDLAPGPTLWVLGPRPFYLKPAPDGWLACVCDQVELEPEATAQLATRPEIESELRELVSRALGPGVRLEQTWCGLRTFGARGPVVGSDPGLRGLSWVAGLGGMGMGAGAEVGRLAAASILGREEPLLAELAPAALGPMDAYASG